MNELCYPLFIWKDHRGLVIFSVIVIATLQFLIIELMATIDIAPIVTTILQQLPPQMQVLFDEGLLTRLSVNGAAAFGFDHPLVLTLMAVNAIIIPTRHIAGEIEDGTLELLLAYPFKRAKLLISLWISTNLILLIIVIGGWLGSLAAVALFSNLTFDLLIRILQIGCNLWLLFALITSYTLLISTFGNEGSGTGIRSAAITLVFYFLYFLSTLWDSISFIKPFNIFTYYQPQKLMFGQRSFGLHVGVLLVLIGICLTISLKQFNRRDIPG